LDTNLSKFWRDWKNVIIITVLVIINITSLTWAPVVASWFKSDPAEIESFSKNIQDTLWLIVFVFAAQIIFSNRRKRIDEKKHTEVAAVAAAEEAAPDAELEAAAQPVEPAVTPSPGFASVKRGRLLRRAASPDDVEKMK